MCQVLDTKVKRTKTQDMLEKAMRMNVTDADILSLDGFSTPAFAVSEEVNGCVSVIIPAHNCAVYLQDCLNSVFNQTWKNLQIIVVDDGSEDGTASILQDYKKSETRLTVYTHPLALGASAARNLGLENATGDYVLFVDADDWLENTAIEHMIFAASKHESAFVIAGYFQDKQQRQLAHLDFLKVTHLNQPALYDYVLQYIAQPYSKVMLVHCWGRLYQRSLIEKFHLRFREALTQFEDVHFNFQYLEKVQAVTYLPECLYHHRIHLNQSLSQKMGTENGFLEKTRTAFTQVSVYLQTKHAIAQETAETMVDGTVINMWLVSVLRLCRSFKNAPSLHIYQKIKEIVSSKAFQKNIKKNTPKSGEGVLLYWACRSNLAPLVLLAGLIRVFFLQIKLTLST